MRTFRFFPLIILLTFALGFAQPAYAAPPSVPGLNDEVCFGGTQTVREGSEVNGSLVSFGCVVVVEDGAVVNGDVVAFGGSVDINGEITSDLVAMGAAVTLDENALILGDLVAPGSSIFRQGGSEVEGQTITESGTDGINIPDIPAIPDIPDITIVPPAQPQSFFERNANIAVQQITNVLLRLFQTFAFSALAVLLVIFIPRHTERVADAIVAQPIITGGIGFLTVIIAPIILVVLTILTFLILSIPAAFGALLLVIGGTFGWIAMGFEVGQRLEDAMNQNWSPPIQAGVGTFFLTLGVAAIGIFWWPFGAVAFIFVSSIGLGAVIMTRLGTREYLGPAPVAVTEDVDPEPDPEPEAKPKPKPKRRTTRKKAEKK
ncbi:MAG: hypothetical protein DWQ07_02655 [Chloroflexi bacterium]|nr:MAG: hypothetical protein DWQ07_02655 [Chloroflexota bacterium]MBL1193600.1 hypothetical protein [Chloroflexota bacterium]NOH10892.1 hypothetical protein [Chloroflexota bacterium]